MLLRTMTRFMKTVWDQLRSMLTTWRGTRLLSMLLMSVSEQRSDWAAGDLSPLSIMLRSSSVSILSLQMFLSVHHSWQTTRWLGQWNLKSPPLLQVFMYHDEDRHIGHDEMFIKDKRGYSQVWHFTESYFIQFSKIIRNLANEAELRVGENVHLNKYVTGIRYKEPGDYPIKITGVDETSKHNFVYKAKCAIMTFR